MARAFPVFNTEQILDRDPDRIGKVAKAPLPLRKHYVQIDNNRHFLNAPPQRSNR